MTAAVGAIARHRSGECLRALPGRAGRVPGGGLHGRAFGTALRPLKLRGARVAEPHPIALVGLAGTSPDQFF